MTVASSTPKGWDERYQRVLDARQAIPETALWIDINDLIVGDQLVISAEPFIVTACAPDGPIVAVEATRGSRTIHTDYLQIERVEVLGPRPLATTNREATP